ncbi:hypothetical protein M1N22_00980 [Dehalococcoidia bacterium]|nr:hypothetical protein [Dehalococcoidia bacterium]MCL0064816.1 hypothetical protein [Dehalococcoidia bacterium]MCL0093353.1 hypothetical protein [Dehalococcoidia bacterium]
MLANSVIDKKSVCRHMGYGADCDPSPRISSLIDEYAENAHHLIEPSYSYHIRDVELVESPAVFVEGSIVFRSQVIARLLGQCHKVAMFVVTIGDYLEEMVAWLARHNNIVQSALLDAIGSDAVERVADSVQGKIEKLAHEQGLVTSRRFSPGYCDWDIRQQKVLFRAVNANLAGVHLTDRCLMIPQKSISGIIGLGPSRDSVEKYNPCKTCDKLDCCGRR